MDQMIFSKFAYCGLAGNPLKSICTFCCHHIFLVVLQDWQRYLRVFLFINTLKQIRTFYLDTFNLQMHISKNKLQTRILLFCQHILAYTALAVFCMGIFFLY